MWMLVLVCWVVLVGPRKASVCDGNNWSFGRNIDVASLHGSSQKHIVLFSCWFDCWHFVWAELQDGLIDVGGCFWDVSVFLDFFDSTRNSNNSDRKRHQTHRTRLQGPFPRAHAGNQTTGDPSGPRGMTQAKPRQSCKLMDWLLNVNRSKNYGHLVHSY